jgi:type IV pilus assembly protein PilO
VAAAGAKDASFAKMSAPVKVVVLLFILGTMTALYYFVFHLSVAEELDVAQAKHAKLQQEMLSARQRQQRYIALSEELSVRETTDRQNKRVLPERSEIAAFLQDLNRLAELSGLRIRIVEPRPEEVESLYVRVPVSLGLNGRFHQVAKFFYNVGRLERAINMENVTLVDPVVSGEEVLLKVDVLATTFRRLGANDGQAQQQAEQ